MQNSPINTKCGVYVPFLSVIAFFGEASLRPDEALDLYPDTLIELLHRSAPVTGDHHRNAEYPWSGLRPGQIVVFIMDLEIDQITN